MEKKVSESRQRMKRMIPKPYEASDKSYGVVCTFAFEYSYFDFHSLFHSALYCSECINERVLFDKLQSRCGNFV